ncbi:hypothetical protein ACOSQ2_019650 [Xanthoceras sorbifolium]
MHASSPGKSRPLGFQFKPVASPPQTPTVINKTSGGHNSAPSPSGTEPPRTLEVSCKGVADSSLGTTPAKAREADGGVGKGKMLDHNNSPDLMPITIVDVGENIGSEAGLGKLVNVRDFLPQNQHGIAMHTLMHEISNDSRGKVTMQEYNHVTLPPSDVDSYKVNRVTGEAVTHELVGLLSVFDFAVAVGPSKTLDTEPVMDSVETKEVAGPVFVFASEIKVKKWWKRIAPMAQDPIEPESIMQPQIKRLAVKAVADQVRSCSTFMDFFSLCCAVLGESDLRLCLVVMWRISFRRNKFAHDQVLLPALDVVDYFLVPNSSCWFSSSSQVAASYRGLG